MRPCKLYKQEFKECKRIKGRFNQYFIYGERLDCTHWGTDYNNCQKYHWFKDTDAGIAVISSELARREKRIEAHRQNDTWTKRDSPPDDWSKPLPQFMLERNENSFLQVMEKFNHSGLVTSENLDKLGERKFCGLM